MSKKDVMTFSKGVSDLETFVNYFAVPGRSCENLNFLAHSWKSKHSFPQKIYKLRQLSLYIF